MLIDKFNIFIEDHEYKLVYQDAMGNYIKIPIDLASILEMEIAEYRLHYLQCKDVYLEAQVDVFNFINQHPEYSMYRAKYLENQSVEDIAQVEDIIWYLDHCNEGNPNYLDELMQAFIDDYNNKYKTRVLLEDLKDMINKDQE